MRGDDCSAGGGGRPRWRISIAALRAAGLMGAVSAPDVGGLGLGFRGAAAIVRRVAEALTGELGRFTVASVSVGPLPWPEPVELI